MKIRRQKYLEQKIWDKNQHVQYYVANILLSFAWNYIDYLDVSPEDISDIVLFGSIANYFYNKKSDINIGIVIKPKPFQKINIIHKDYFYAGRRVSLSVIGATTNNTRYCSGPVFSLLKNEWIHKPVMISDAEFKCIKAQTKIMFKRMLNDYNVVKKSKFEISLVRELYNNLITSLNMNLRENPDQNITSVLLAFNEMKYRGFIDKLKDKISDYAQQGAK